MQQYILIYICIHTVYREYTHFFIYYSFIFYLIAQRHEPHTDCLGKLKFFKQASNLNLNTRNFPCVNSRICFSCRENTIIKFLLHFADFFISLHNKSLSYLPSSLWGGKKIKHKCPFFLHN